VRPMVAEWGVDVRVLLDLAKSSLSISAMSAERDEIRT
jgi:hypothetical protein